MKHSLRVLCTWVENITSWHHDHSAEPMPVPQQADGLGLVIVASQLHAKRRSCIAGIHHLTIR